MGKLPQGKSLIVLSFYLVDGHRAVLRNSNGQLCSGPFCQVYSVYSTLLIKEQLRKPLKRCSQVFATMFWQLHSVADFRVLPFPRLASQIFRTCPHSHKRSGFHIPTWTRCRQRHLKPKDLVRYIVLARHPCSRLQTTWRTLERSLQLFRVSRLGAARTFMDTRRRAQQKCHPGSLFSYGQNKLFRVVQERKLSVLEGSNPSFCLITCRRMLLMQNAPFPRWVGLPNLRLPDVTEALRAICCINYCAFAFHLLFTALQFACIARL